MKRREKVIWCFTPCQPLQLYQRERQRERQRQREKEKEREKHRERQSPRETEGWEEGGGSGGVSFQIDAVGHHTSCLSAYLTKLFC